ncbi:MFS transporter permease [Microterricola pindariensis]|uniref:DivIVA domain-containing protein n=2 Tax=Microterricola TaxID=518733 RepID=A0A1H1T990_9MICO|nr:MFS transporter permease [Microterricola pindariensis]SDS56586.1 DivIVA domain-containing protein [Microterricola viridarii]
MTAKRNDTEEKSSVSTTFPRARRPKLGYKVEQVEEFLRLARAVYDGTAPADTTLSADGIRRTAFAMAKNGYSTAHVDAALERLEDAFAAREREQAAQAMGDAAWFQEARSSAQEILNRIARPAKHRFQRVSFLTIGYSVEDVDKFATRLASYFEKGTPITVDDVRTVVFRPQRGGYREVQVDIVLDAVVDVMLAVR